uniref:Uncharacterized protein n=1 Tax=Anguilla anguilla TaxID=7936 RepID=A0A0E9REZ0_ANGAN
MRLFSLPTRGEKDSGFDIWLISVPWNFCPAITTKLN